jgi:hypothetical protein
MAAAALVLKLTSFEYQDNRVLIAFFLPCWTGLLVASLAARAATVRSNSSPASADPREIRAELAPVDTKR